jgi:hypothetical protein
MAQTHRALGRKAEPAKDEAGHVAVEGTDVDKFEEKVQVRMGEDAFEEKVQVRTGENAFEERVQVRM